MQDNSETEKNRLKSKKYYYEHHDEILEKLKLTKIAKRKKKLTDLGIPDFLEPYAKINKLSYTLIVSNTKALLDLCELICANIIVDENNITEEKSGPENSKVLGELGIPSFLEPYIRMNKCSYSLVVSSNVKDLLNLCRTIAIRYPKWKNEQIHV